MCVKMREEAKNLHISPETSINNERDFAKRKCTALRGLCNELCLELCVARAWVGWGGSGKGSWWDPGQHAGEQGVRSWRRPWDSDLSPTQPAEGWPVARGRQDKGKGRSSSSGHITSQHRNTTMKGFCQIIKVNDATGASTAQWTCTLSSSSFKTEESCAKAKPIADLVRGCSREST